VPVLAVVCGRGQVDLDAGLVESEAGQRHQVLPADQPADVAESGRDGLQTLPVSEAPDEPFVVRRHQLAVVERELTLGRIEEERVVDRPAL